MMNKIKNYSFKNENLLMLALTHSSFGEENYERLEFLGDSILDFLVAEYFFGKTKHKEGDLSKMRAYYVSEDSLSVVFDSLNVLDYVRLGKSCKTLTKSIKSDMVEAIIAGIYLDSNMEECRKFVLSCFDFEKDVVSFNDGKSQLQEWAQKYKKQVNYELIKSYGEAHDLTFVIQAKVDNISAVCEGKTKKQAEENCAYQILKQINAQENKGDSK